MSSIPFFAPVLYGNNIAKTNLEKAAEWVDSYFYLGGRQACIISTDGVRQTHMLSPRGKPPFLCTVLKVISYATVVLPLLGLALKAILRKCINLPERVKGISPFAVGSLPIDLSRNFDFTIMFTEKVRAALSDKEKQSCNKTMYKVVSDIIKEINTIVQRDVRFSQGNDEWIVLPLNKSPLEEKASQYYGFTQLYRDTTMKMRTEAKADDPFIIDVVLNALEEQGYIRNLNRQVNNLWQEITVL